MADVHRDDDGASKKKVYDDKYFPVHAHVEQRISVRDFFSTDGDQKKRDLFLRAFSAFQNNPNNADIWSYFAIAGIHGYPILDYDPTDNSPHEGPNIYCQHAVPSFPSWHRAYVLLFEMAIKKAAFKIADSLPGTQQAKAECREVAESLRLPYFDWESKATNGEVPQIFLEEKVKVKYPYEMEEWINNPLHSYVLPLDVVENATGLYKAKSPVVRGTQWTEGFKQMYDTQFNQDGHRIMSINTWNQFSNKGSHSQRDSTGNQLSMEGVHDNFHGIVGYPEGDGDMNRLALAAFDPIFWFHHCNVDRLFAFWQELHPGQYFSDVPGVNDELVPFWGSKTEGRFVTSKDMEDFEALGYTYPAIVRGREVPLPVAPSSVVAGRQPNSSLSPQPMTLGSPELMRFHILQDCASGSFDGIHWYLNLLNVPKGLVITSFEIRVFLNLPDANIRTPLNVPNYAGSIYVFVRADQSECKTCQKVTHIRGSVELTSTMKKLGILTDSEISTEIAHEVIDQHKVPPIPEGITKTENPFNLVYVSTTQQEIKPPSEVNETLGVTAVLGEKVVGHEFQWKNSSGQPLPSEPSS